MTRLWALSDGRAGIRAQSLGLATALAKRLEATVIEKEVRLPSWLKVLPPAWASRCHGDGYSETPPDIAVGCGVAAYPALLRLRRRHGTFVICLQRPPFGARHFDCVVAPRHDYENPPNDGRHFLVLGSVGGVSASELVERRDEARQYFDRYLPPYTTVLVGGDNRAYRMDADRLAVDLQKIAESTGGSLLVTTSRRTPSEVRQALRRTLTDAHYLWDGQGENPYLHLLAAADRFFVTADSVNMLSEAAAAGRSVFILPLPLKHGWRARRTAKKFSRFHGELVAGQHAAWWTGRLGDFTPVPLDETARVADLLVEMIGKAGRLP